MNPVNEWFLVWLVPLRIGLVLVFATLYAIGGRGPKWVRRFLGGALFGSAVMGLSMWTGTFKWWLVGLPGAYIGALVLGYGGDTFVEKLFRRAIFGLALGCCALLAASVQPVWGLGVFQVSLALAASIFLGIWNPVKAVNEEALIATLSVVCVPFMV